MANSAKWGMIKAPNCHGIILPRGRKIKGFWRRHFMTRVEPPAPCSVNCKPGGAEDQDLVSPEVRQQLCHIVSGAVILFSEPSPGTEVDPARMGVNPIHEVRFFMQQTCGLDIFQTLDDVCDPARLALVVYDMQVGIVEQIENGPEITEKVVQVLTAARKARIRTFFTRHMSLPKELMGASQFRTAMAWQRVKSPEEVKPWFPRDAPGFQLVPKMNPLLSEATFDKITMSAFEGTPLNIALRDCGITAFAIVGIALEIGIEPTVRHGADLGYIPVVIKDACGYGHRDAADRSIASLEFAGDALLTDANSICKQFERVASGTSRLS